MSRVRGSWTRKFYPARRSELRRIFRTWCRRSSGASAPALSTFGVAALAGQALPAQSSGMDLSCLSALLSQQSGVVSRRQLLRAGLTDNDIARLLRRRELARVHSGVYVDHTGPLSWLQRAGRRPCPTGLPRCATTRRCWFPGCAASIRQGPSRSRSTKSGGWSGRRVYGSGGSPGCRPWCSRTGPRHGCGWSMPCSDRPRVRRMMRTPSRCSRTPASSAAPHRHGFWTRSERIETCRAEPSWGRCLRTSPAVPTRCSSTATSPGSNDRTVCPRRRGNEGCAPAGRAPTGTWSTCPCPRWWSSTVGWGTRRPSTAGTISTETSRASWRATPPCGLAGGRCSTAAAPRSSWPGCSRRWAGPGTRSRADRAV